MSDRTDETDGAAEAPRTDGCESAANAEHSDASHGSAPDRLSGQDEATMVAASANEAAISGVRDSFGQPRERQFVFDFPRMDEPPASFLVTEANRDAARLVRAPELWSPAACVVGPHGSGKTHLAREFFAAATVFPASALASGRADTAVGGAEDGVSEAAGRLLELVAGAEIGVVLDDIDDMFESAGVDAAERLLFHMFNRAKERGAKILLLARTPPARWPVMLPDLRTRLRTAPIARIDGPDDALLAHLLRRRFTDAGFRIDTATVQYLLARLPRSFEAVEDAVERVNERAWASDQQLSIPFVRGALSF